MTDDNKPPSEKDTEPQETLRYSANADKRVWERMVLRGDTAYCYCGRKIDDAFQHGDNRIVIKHNDKFYNPLTCSIRGQITDRMKEKIYAQT